VKAESPRRLFRHGKLVVVIVAPLLLLGVAVSAPAQDRQDKKPVVQVNDGDLSLCGASPRAKTASEKSCLRGKVRAITAEAGTARPQGGGLVEGTLYLVTKDTYDERGNVTLREISDSGNGPGPVGLVFRRGVNGYDEQGRMTSSKWYEAGADEPQSVLAYTYDERGNRVKIDSWRTKPDAHIIQEFSYDAEGHEAGTTFRRLTPGGWQTSRSKHVTTVEGGLTRVRTYSPDGALQGRTEVLKDERGNILSEELYRTDAQGEEQLQWKVAYRYDREGFLREVVYHKADASLGARAVYEYDEMGNCTSLMRYNADGTFAVVLQRKYEYDAAGNWVTCVSFSLWWENRAPEPYNIVRRQIAYY
jgi:YD repeat-containing protein